MKKMKLILGILTLGAATIISNQAYAQKGGGDGNTFEVGTMTVNIGIGAGRSSFGGYGIYSGSYYGYGTGLGVKAAVERGMWQLGPGVLSLGAEIGGSFSSSSGYKSNIVIIAARSAYHFGWGVDKLDTYGGFSLGPGFKSYDYYDGSKNKKNEVVIAPGFFVGASYYFSPNIGVNVEGIYDITMIQGGIIFKLK